MTAAELATIRATLDAQVAGARMWPFRGRGRFAAVHRWDFAGARARGYKPAAHDIRVEVFRYGRGWRVWRDGRAVDHGHFGVDVALGAARVLDVVRRAAGEPRPAVHTGMSWHDIRRQWNAEGQCARQACRADLPDPAPVHRDSGLLYCHACKRLINRTNGMVLVAVPGATP